MNEELERWAQDAPAQVRAAKSAYAQLAPDEARLARILEGVELRVAATDAGAGWLSTLKRGALWGVAALTAAAVVWKLSLDAPVPSVPAAEERTKADPPVAEPATPALEPATRVLEPATPALAPNESEPTAPSAAPLPTPNPNKVRPRTKDADPIQELTLLTRARRVLRADPARTLALCSEHARDYPRGTLSEERELLAIEALAGLDQRVALTRRAAAFSRKYPGSVHLPRVREIVGQ